MVEPKKKRHILLKTVLGFFGVLVGAAVLIAAANAVSTAIDKAFVAKLEPVFYEDRLTPELDEQTGYYTFTTDREFKLMQLTDLHLGSAFLTVDNDKQAIKAVETMIRAEKPDLVIITGDAIFPVPQSGTLNNKTELQLLMQLMDRLGVYWAYTFGNHEYQGPSYLDESGLAALLEGSSPYCLFQRGPENVSGEGNYVINVKNTDGVITRSLILLDSHAYTPEDKWGLNGAYDNIHEDQVAWYTKTVNMLTQMNRQAISDVHSTEKRSAYSEQFGIVKSFVFFHIPLREYRTVWEEYKQNNYQDSPDIQYKYGYMGEQKAPYIYCGEGEDELFERAVELGSTEGFFCGHDHTNNFSFIYKGIRLSYGMSIDSLVYKNIQHLGAQRGCTLITCGSDGSSQIKAENYYQPKYDFEGKEEVTMQTLNEEQEIGQGE